MGKNPGYHNGVEVRGFKGKKLNNQYGKIPSKIDGNDFRQRSIDLLPFCHHIKKRKTQNIKHMYYFTH